MHAIDIFHGQDNSDALQATAMSRKYYENILNQSLELLIFKNLKRY